MQSPRVSIRSYSTDTKSHQHAYHQLVMPLQGAIRITVGSFQGEVSPSDCVIIKAGCDHAFSALEQAKFLVADCPTLPLALLEAESEVVCLASPVLAYIRFIEQQLMYLPKVEVEPKLVGLLLELLSQQSFISIKDKRIQQAVEYIEANLASELSIQLLSELACLSVTQFKKRFKQATDLSCQEYIVQKRMERAKALLLRSDTPINLVAEMVGYQSQSAFTRRFKKTFGLTPNKIASS